MKKLISYLSIIVILTSCEKDVNVNIPKKDPKLVINAIIAKDSVIRVSIGRTRSVLDPQSSGSTENYVVKNAVVLAYENGVFIDTLSYDNLRYVSKHQKTVTAGNNYTIKANATGYAQAEASSLMPSQSVIAEVARVKNARIDRDGNPEDEITIKINDPVEVNFYMVQFYRGAWGTDPGYPVYCVSTSDKDIEPIGDNADPFSTDNCYDGNKLMMKDVNFNGKQKLLRFYINSYELQGGIGGGGQPFKSYVKVLRITEDYFRFVKSYDVYYNSSDNPFAEPSNVYTNVKNGYGIFALFTEAKKDL